MVSLLLLGWVDKNRVRGGKHRSVPQRSAILACRTPRRFWSKHLIWTLFRTKHPWTEKGPEFNEEKMYRTVDLALRKFHKPCLSA